MLRCNLPDFITLPGGTMLYPVIGGYLKQQRFTTATSRDAIAAEAKRRKLKYRRVEVLSRNLRGNWICIANRTGPRSGSLSKSKSGNQNFR